MIFLPLHSNSHLQYTRNPSCLAQQGSIRTVWQVAGPMEWQGTGWRVPPSHASFIGAEKQHIWPLTVSIRTDSTPRYAQMLAVGALTTQKRRMLQGPPFSVFSKTSKSVCGRVHSPSLIFHLSWECVSCMLSWCVMPCPEVSCPCDRFALMTVRRKEGS